MILILCLSGCFGRRHHPEVVQGFAFIKGQERLFGANEEIRRVVAEC